MADDPVPAYIARKRINRLRDRVYFLQTAIDTGRKEAGSSYLRSELSALRWAIDELRRIYPQDGPPDPLSTNRPY